jgi:hypothetical protein
MGQRDIRRLLITGAMAVVRCPLRHGAPQNPWLARLLERKPPLVAALSLANKMARGIWAMMTRSEDYRDTEIGSAACSGGAVRTGPPSCEEDMNCMDK